MRDRKLCKFNSFACKNSRERRTAVCWFVIIKKINKLVKNEYLVLKVIEEAIMVPPERDLLLNTIYVCVCVCLELSPNVIELEF